jgi:UDPglucose 6-dehydrogenase
MKVVVFGTGYVGLVQAVGLAYLGFEVTGIDIDEQKIESLRRGDVPFYEPGISEHLMEMIKVGRLEFSLDWNGEGEVIFVCVPTPGLDNGECDLRAVKAVFERIAETDFKGLVVVKSTIPPRALDDLENRFRDKFEIASNPEFLREGMAWQDFLKPERIVLGVRTAEAFQALKKLYRKIDAPVFGMSVESAQLAKYASNTMLAARLSIMNEIANIADLVDADIKDVERVVGADRRIGKSFIRSGAGFGGSCFPKDVLALSKLVEKFEYKTKLIEPIVELNNEQYIRFVELIEREIGELQDVGFGVWGLAFNANTDDVRESPAMRICQELLNRGAKLKVYDPRALRNAEKDLVGEIEFFEEANRVLPAKALLVLTEWPEFHDTDWEVAGTGIESRKVFDGKNFLNRDRIRAGGLEYCGIGICKTDVPGLGNLQLD